MPVGGRRLRRRRACRILNNVGPRRVIPDRLDPLNSLCDEELFARYRFRRPTLIFLETELRQHTQHETHRNQSLSPMLQLLLCLRFLATGAFHILVGDSLNISKSSAGRCARNVSKLIVRVFRRFLSFPIGDEVPVVMEGFRKIADFPRVIGCVDGTHINIATPSENEADYVNRKGQHSLNVQMVCDHRFRIRSVTANWPGSVHDSRIWRECALSQQFENDVHEGFILGDSGYPCTRYLLTPFLSPANRPETRYNSSLCRTRVLIEQTFGFLKRRFPVLRYGIRSSPERCVIYTVACVILHNIGIEKGDVLVSDEELEICDHVQQDQQIPCRGDGIAMRRHITNTFFA